MIEISNERSGKFTIQENGEHLMATRSLKGISDFLNEEKPEEVESHIFTGNTLHFDLEMKDEELLKDLIVNRFKKENDCHFVEEE